MWGHCEAKFASLAELVGHVNLDHLRLPVNQKQDVNSVNLASDIANMTCQWSDCTAYPPHAIPTSSTGDQASEVLNFLTSHLLNDHLGIIDLDQAPVATTTPSSEKSGGLDTSPSPDVFKCRWRSCERSFAGNESLTQHLNSDHIGSGKAYYECFWDDCNRSGKAATLQQHMRRHTQEKPYICDYPGCGKTFAITGALTIHKRIHNGQKPFKCKFCDNCEPTLARAHIVVLSQDATNHLRGLTN
ncbi:hypothetical protein C0995_008470 [Termitomyces sp. Mi166|nr:hypothetical protein C0995_008470 [Termitomyces sp. Mi166\